MKLLESSSNDKEVTSSSLPSSSRSISTTTTTTASTTTTAINTAVLELKKVLEREYISFFNPMRTEYYASDVTFDDPLTSLAGVQAYQTNVDMLSGRTLLGSILFEDGAIQLHSITGGTVEQSNNHSSETDSTNQRETTTISDIVTRWTLRFTMKVFPWKPTARFSGVSIYKVKPIPTKPGVQIIGQTDYWDSINLIPKQDSNNSNNNNNNLSETTIATTTTEYQKVPKTVALMDFLQQLKPGGFQATAAAPELPYSLLRRGMGGYEVRRYPAYTAIRIKYGRRDEGFGTLGAFTKSTESPSSPAIMTVASSSMDDKFMMWPLTYSIPGQGDDDTIPPEPTLAKEKIQDAQWRKCQIITQPSSVVAVLDFSDVSMEPVVRKADAQLRQYLERDGLQPKQMTLTSTTTTTTTEENSTTNSLVPKQPIVQFAQYDAIFSMGKRRSEVWIELEDGGHPW